jgi:CRISPR-associated protein Cmr3
MHLSITPLDTVFFRDGKAFTMGEETQAEGLFPPPPSVVYGALRTRYFAERPAELPKAGTEEGPTQSAQITHLALQRGSRTLFPLPRDLARRKEAPASEAVRTRPATTGSAALGSSSVPAPLTHRATVETIENGYVDHVDLRRYLSGEPPGEGTFTVIPEGDLVEAEPKIGIKMDRETRASQEGHLYRVGLRRLQNDVQFRVRVDNLPIDPEGLLKLGGEAKPARYEVLSEGPPALAPSAEAIEQSGGAILYLMTPAIFEGGWRPSWLGPDEETEHRGLRLRLTSAAVGKPRYLGGWDMKENRPKAMLKAVPSGSVYHLQIEPGAAEALIERFHGQSISERRGREGFGLCYVGAALPTAA